MHFEILVEDQSGKRMLEILLPKLLGDDHSVRVIAYKGVGRLPKGLQSGSAANKRILLDNLPRLLRGYGKTFAAAGDDYAACVMVVVDLDDNPFHLFLNELEAVLTACDPAPTTQFCLAVEEGEAWLLGDRAAVLVAYPRAKVSVLDSYKQDSICGTWEVLANAIYPGGSAALKAKGWQAAGAEKSNWATSITPMMDPSNNVSPSFQRFLKAIDSLLGKTEVQD